jgi:pimeloyl-ACP methyl ester carboxylesterase
VARRLARVVRAVLVAGVVVVVAALVVERVAPDPVARGLLALDRARSGLEAARIAVDDVQIAYLEGGHGEPLILVHGFGADKDNFTRVAAYLTPHYRVLIPDMPGFGDSSRPDGVSYGIDAQAERLGAFARAVGARRPHLGGNSMGGMIVTQYAIAHPDDVASLWLLAPAGTRAAFDSALGRQLAAGGPNPLVPHTPTDFDTTMAFVMADVPRIPYAVRHFLAARAVADAPLHERVFGEVGPGRVALLDDGLRGLAVPTLVVWGTADRALDPKAAETYRALMPNVRVRLLDGVGHLPMLEAPAAAAHDYLAFRAGLAAGVRP